MHRSGKVAGLIRAFCFGVALACGAAACATEPAAHVSTALVWETKRSEQTAVVGQARAEVIFPFRNSGSKPATITAIESSCGCTSARLTKNTYAPGETGEIRALFEFEDRVGPQQKVLTVHTDDSPVATHLVLRVDIPETLVVEPRVLQWKSDEPPQFQLISVRTPISGVDMVRVEVGPGTDVEAALEPMAEAGRYQVKVRPRTATAGLRRTVHVRAFVNNQPRSVPVHLFVR